jgi:EpsI family protein
MKSPRFWTVFLLLAATALILYNRGDSDRVPPSEPLALLPHSIDNLTAEDFPLDAETLSVLGKGDFLNRMYSSEPPTYEEIAANPKLSHKGAPPVGLFIGYFPTQRTGQSIHSPQHCLPGAGWVFDSQKYTDLQDINGKHFTVGEYVINNGEVKQFVIYWYQAHGRSVANEYKAKLYMVADAIRTNRTDGSIVRVITQIAPSESIADARDRAVSFTTNLTPLLPRFIPD